MNKKKKSTNTSPYPDKVIDRLARAFYPAILACWNSEEGQREFAAWQAEQAHHTPSKENQSVPDGERPVVHISVVCGFFRVRPGGRTLFLFYTLIEKNFVSYCKSLYIFSYCSIQTFAASIPQSSRFMDRALIHPKKFMKVI